MTRRVLTSFILLLAVLSACETAKGLADEDTAQLERFKVLQAERDHAAIAAEEVTARFARFAEGVRRAIPECAP